MVPPLRHAQPRATPSPSPPPPPLQQSPRQPNPPGGHSPVAKRRAAHAQKEEKEELTPPPPPPQLFKVSLAQARSVYGRRAPAGNEPLLSRRPDRLATLFPPDAATSGYPGAHQSLVAAAPAERASPSGASSSRRSPAPSPKHTEEVENTRRALVDRQLVIPSPTISAVSEEAYACCFVEDLMSHVVETETADVHRGASRGALEEAEATAAATCSTPRPWPPTPTSLHAQKPEQRSEQRLVAPAELPPVATHVRRIAPGRDHGMASRPMMPSLDDLLAPPLPSARSGKHHARLEAVRLPRAPLTAR